MVVYIIEKRYYADKNNKESVEYYSMPYDLKGNIKSIGFWKMFKMFMQSRAFLMENMADFNAKYSRF